MKRNCGCRDDTIQVKKKLFKEFKQQKVNDDLNNIIYIGIVFHICYQNYVINSITDDITYTINMLNNDFSKKNSNFDNGKNVYADDELKKLYTQYVNLASTSNIVFYHVDTKYVSLIKQNSSNLSILDKNIKAQSKPVSPDKYLNIWVADFDNGLLGYAQFPWELNSNPSTDGVVIAKGTFGKNPEFTDFNLNKTLTHEIGHWLGLYHTFQNTFNYEGGAIDYRNGTKDEELQEIKGDCVVDTPPQGQPTYGNPLNTPYYWPSSKPYDESTYYKHMFMNFMDYSDDIALFMFTKDQIIKLRQMIHIYRPNILLNKPPVIPSINETDTINQPGVSIISNPFTYLYHGFEYGDDDNWKSKWILSKDAEITSTTPFIGYRCLRIKYKGSAEIMADLSGCNKAILSFFAKVRNMNTKVWVKPPKSEWKSIKLEYDIDYQNFVFELPGPFNSTDNQYYTIKFTTDGTSSSYSYFDNIMIRNIEILDKFQ